MVDLHWDPPGDGVWWLAREHLPVPVCRLFAELFPPTTDGWAVGAEAYGIPFGRARWGAVNGWLYYGPPDPPDPATYPALEQTARETLATARWRDEVARWLEVERPPIVAANRAFQSVDVGRLDDEALAAHLTGLVDHYHAVGPLHFAHTGFDFAGGFLVQAARGWGIEDPMVVAAMAGASPASSATLAHIDAIAANLGAPPRQLADIEGPQLGAYLDEFGWRLLGRDLVEPTLAEIPHAVLASVQARMAAPARSADDGIEALRARVPSGERGRFEALLDDARASYRLRDDDVGVCINWPLGLVRRAGLEIARRVTLVNPVHVFEAEPAELIALLAGGGPSPPELAARAEIRIAAASADPPLQLGEIPPSRPEPPLPRSVGVLVEARNALWSVDANRQPGELRGTGIGSKVARGRACVIDDPDAIERMEPGAVIVATATMAAHNPIFPIAAAVVTREGGLFSHAAILSREFGIPAVVGVAGLLQHVHDGDEIEVDPVGGVVRVLRRRDEA